MSKSFLSWDWKSCPDVEDLCSALGPLGIYVYEDPLFEGTDTYGYLFSKVCLTNKELEKASNSYHGL